jgi:hypothetical protein
MPNVDKLRETMEFIKTNPENHRQEVWVGFGSCGTVACIAGWRAIQDGVRVPDTTWSASMLTLINTDAMAFIASDGWPNNAHVMPVWEFARRSFDLDLDTADWLFSGSNNMAYLETAVGALCTGGRIDRETGDVYDKNGDRVFVRDEMVDD